MKLTFCQTLKNKQCVVFFVMQCNNLVIHLFYIVYSRSLLIQSSKMSHDVASGGWPVDGAVWLQVGRTSSGGVQVSLRYRLCCRVQPAWTSCRFQTHSRRCYFPSASGPWWFFGAFPRRGTKQTPPARRCKLKCGQDSPEPDRLTSTPLVITLFSNGGANYCPGFSFFSKPKCLRYARDTFPSCCVCLDLDLEASTDATKCAKFSNWGK